MTSARERHLDEIQRTKEEIRRGGYCRKRDMRRHLRNLYRELKIYDEYMRRNRAGEIDE